MGGLGWGDADSPETLRAFRYEDVRNGWRSRLDAAAASTGVAEAAQAFGIWEFPWGGSAGNRGRPRNATRVPLRR